MVKGGMVLKSCTQLAPTNEFHNYFWLMDFIVIRNHALLAQ